ncbi:MAG: hypothetical protein LBI96_02250 [Odoribacteraceae bacterium]|jgi:hypothetical protein|nr:hypothetical protein [Odoribacteraceae bacterium]
MYNPIAPRGTGLTPGLNDNTNDLSAGYRLMTNQHHVDALLFWLSRDQENTVVQYNTALCHLLAGDPVRARERLEACIRNIRITRPIPANAATNNLLQAEARSANYKNPLSPESLTLCPELVLARANRLLYDTCLQQGDDTTARRLAATLAHKQYSNIK